jgi:hypothetical protein
MMEVWAAVAECWQCFQNHKEFHTELCASAALSPGVHSASLLVLSHACSNAGL